MTKITLDDVNNTDIKIFENLSNTEIEIESKFYQGTVIFKEKIELFL